MGTWDYAEVQAKMNQPAKPEDATDLTDIEDDAVVDEEEREGEEETEESTEEEKPVAEVPSPVAKPAAAGVPPPGELTPRDKQAVADEVIRRMGKDTVLRIKGQEVKIADLSPDELINHLQKGIRGDQLMQEAAAQRREVERQRALVEQGAQRVQSILDEYGKKGANQPGQITQLPDHLRPTPDDTPEVLAWKRDQVMQLDRLNQLETYVKSSAESQETQKIISEVETLGKEYPLASIDEVLAVKSVRPNINAEELVRASHNYYTSSDHIKSAMKHNPTFKREYDAEVIKNYLASKQGVKRMPGTKRVPANIDKTTAPRQTPTVKGFEDADALSRQYIRELKRLEAES